MCRFTSKVSPAFLITVPDGLKMTSRSANQGETMFQRTDRPQNSPIVTMQRIW